jgi:hypothetical protein
MIKGSLHIIRDFGIRPRNQSKIYGIRPLYNITKLPADFK